jgi:hypothetical protein
MAQAVWVVVSRLLHDRKAATYLGITRKLLFALLLVVLCVGILSSSNRGLVNFNARMSIFHHHTPLRRSFSSILGEFSFHDSLNRERSSEVLVSYPRLIGAEQILTR